MGDPGALRTPARFSWGWGSRLVLLKWDGAAGRWVRIAVGHLSTAEVVHFWRAPKGGCRPAQKFVADPTVAVFEYVPAALSRQVDAVR